MKVVGVFRELEPRSKIYLPSIHDFRNKMNVETAEHVLEYLSHWEPIFDVMEFTIDPFDLSKGCSGGSSLITDGEWIWRKDLAYLIEHYYIGLPIDFIYHCTKNTSVSLDRGLLIQNIRSYVDAYDKSIS
jgi:hypothetical protein